MRAQRPLPSVSLSLPEDAIHVWYALLHDPAIQGLPLHQLLNDEERGHAARLRAEPDRATYCLARGILRGLLESYGVAPAREVVFTRSAHGKPELAAGQGCPALHFNMAHVPEMAVFAFARARPVGIDVERLRAVPDADAVVRQFFAREEQAEYRALRPEARARGFLNAWTRKEAFTKALGLGLSYLWQDFAVTLTPGVPSRLLRVETDPAAPGQWLLEDVTIDPAFVCAVAAPGTRLRFSIAAWPP